MIKALIIDDEPSAVSTLQLMVERYIPEITSLLSTNDAHEGIQMIKSLNPHLLFLDIQMPVINGFELLKQLPQINFNIIFTTAYDQYAIEAIRFSALDYLMKPIDADELSLAVNRFMSRQAFAQGQQQSLYNNLLHNITRPDKKDFKMALPTTQGTFFFKPEEIIRLEGESNYTKFFLVNQKSILISKTLKEYEEILSEHNFIRIHKSHLINIKHVVSSAADSVLIMTDSSKVEISRRRKEMVMEALRKG